MGVQPIERLLDELAVQVDTRFEGVQGDYRALIVVNPTDAPYTGIAVLHVDMLLKAGSVPRPAAVWTPDGTRVPCQILNSHLEPVSEWLMPDGTVRPLPDGSRRWRFDLAFWVESISPRSYRVYRSEWSTDELPLPTLSVAELPVRVREARPHAGELGKEGSLDGRA